MPNLDGSPTPEEMFRAKLTGLPSSNDASGQQSIRDALAKASATPDTPVAQDSFINRLRGTASRELQNPTVAGIASSVGGLPSPSNFEAVRGLGRAIDPPRPDGITRVTRPEVQQLNPSTAWTNVEAAPELKLTQPTVGRPAGGPAAPGTPDYFNDMRKGVSLLGEKAARQGDLGVAEADAAEQTADLNEQHALHLQDIADQEKAANEQTAQDQKAFLAKTQQMADEIGQMKVDPSRLWHEKGAGERIGFGIAAALSGLASGLTGKPDQFISTWSQAIDRDIDAQKAAIENKKASLSARNSVFAQMLQQTGDARTAREATKSLMLQGLGQQIKAQADRLGVPIITAKSNLLINGVQQEQNQAQAGVDKAVYDWGQARAAAAAAAAAAQRKYVDERTDKLTEQAFKRDELTLKRMELEKKNGDDTQKQVAELGKQLSDPKLATGRATVNALDAAVAKAGGAAPEGLGYGARALRGVVGDSIAARILGDDANINEQNYNDLMGVIRNMKTGSGSSEAERQMIMKEAEGAGTWAEKRNAIIKAKAFFDQQENAARAGYSPEVNAAYDANKNRLATSMPGSVQRK